MPIITLPDGNNLNFPNKVTGLEVAEKISKSLAKQAIVIGVNGELKDLDFVIDEKTGFLFNSGDAKSLSEKILKALSLDDTALKSIGIEGRKNIIQKFNVEKMCFSTYSEYKRILN